MFAQCVNTRVCRHFKNIFVSAQAEPQWTATPGSCKKHRRKRRRGGRKGWERERKVQRGDVDGEVKGGGRGG